jgi:hypothetical protein
MRMEARGRNGPAWKWFALLLRGLLYVLLVTGFLLLMIPSAS